MTTHGCRRSPRSGAVDAEVATADAGIFGCWNAPVAAMTWSVSIGPIGGLEAEPTAGSALAATTASPSVEAWTGAPIASAYRRIRAATASRGMNPSGSPSAYGESGSPVVTVRADEHEPSQRSCQPPPSVSRRSSTTCDRPAAWRCQLISTDPAWPAPIQTASIVLGSVSVHRSFACGGPILPPSQGARRARACHWMEWCRRLPFAFASAVGYAQIFRRRLGGELRETRRGSASPGISLVAPVISAGRRDPTLASPHTHRAISATAQ